jgi:alpha-1,2-mannosyltransferase
LSLSADEAVAMRLRARKSSRRFSEEVFAAQWLRQMDKLVALQKASK